MSGAGTPQTRDQLNALFADTDLAQAITPSTMRDLVASVPVVANGAGWQLTATGSSITDGLALTQLWNFFSTVASGTGCNLPATAAALLTELTIWNAGAHTLTVYASPGDVVILQPGGLTVASFGLTTGHVVRMAAIAPGFWAVSNTFPEV